MSQTTRATLFLQQQGIAFALASYTYDPSADSIGLAAAEALGVPPRRVLKTLMVLADGMPACAVLPSDHELSLKKMAAACGAKSAAMMKPEEAERISGYHIGGISPFGQKKRLPIVVEVTALSEDSVYLNGGQRGLQIHMAPGDIIRALSAMAAAIAA